MGAGGVAQNPLVDPRGSVGEAGHGGEYFHMSSLPVRMGIQTANFARLNGLYKTIKNCLRRHGMIISTDNPPIPTRELLPFAVAVACDGTTLRVSLADGREIAVPIAWFPTLQHATPEQQQQWQLIGRGEGIHWEAIDEDISVASLLGLPSD